jgi:hypothetical protein
MYIRSDKFYKQKLEQKIQLQYTVQRGLKIRWPVQDTELTIPEKYLAKKNTIFRRKKASFAFYNFMSVVGEYRKIQNNNLAKDFWNFHT